MITLEEARGLAQWWVWNEEIPEDEWTIEELRFADGDYRLKVFHTIEVLEDGLSRKKALRVNSETAKQCLLEVENNWKAEVVEEEEIDVEGKGLSVFDKRM